MRNNLIVSMGTLHKKAQGLPGEGPSFEQQFGILANAQITDKYPALGPCKVAFQLQDKNDLNTFAVGASVYKLGKAFTYIPAVFRNGKIWTGVIQFVPSMNRFLPISDAWLSYIKNHDTGLVGDTVPVLNAIDIAASPLSARARDVLDPFVKTSSALRTVFDTALTMGKTASEALLDKLEDTDFLNDALKFYSPELIASFAKHASSDFLDLSLFKPVAITLFDKRAKLLTALLKQEVYRDGFIIKTASLDSIIDYADKPDVSVIRIKLPSTLFRTPTLSCTCDILLPDGLLDKNVTVFNAVVNYTNSDIPFPETGSRSFGYRREVSAKDFLKHNADNNALAKIVLTLYGYAEIGKNVVALASSILPIKLNTKGHAYSSLKLIPYDSAFILPNGTAYIVSDGFYKGLGLGAFYSYDKSLTFADLEDLIAPVFTSNAVVFPKGTKIVFRYLKERNADGTYVSSDKKVLRHAPTYVLIADLPRVLDKFIAKNFTKLKVYSDGSLVSVSSANKPDEGRTQVKLAALKLVTDYGISQLDAKFILKLVMNKAAAKQQPLADTFYLLKTAAAKFTFQQGCTPKGWNKNVEKQFSDLMAAGKLKLAWALAAKYGIKKTAAIPDDATTWLLANIGMTLKPNLPPLVTKRDLNNYTGDNASMLDISAAVDAGIKLVFDMQTLKLLALAADPGELVIDAIPDFMNCLDKLGRLIYLYHTHMDDMELKYGAVKMLALSRSLLNTLKDLAELTVFIKLRGLGNDANNNPDAGLLQTGEFL